MVFFLKPFVLPKKKAKERMSYACAACGKQGVKLWRPYQCSPDDFFCIRHFSEETDDARVGPVDGEQMPPPGVEYVSDETLERVKGGLTDQLGWWVPAIPMLETEGACWGYTSVPGDRVEWWKGLPF